tara:strand:+ start:201 stop:1553 length:1353 start_codon:yes stop_codon:yes gene_type:complete
MVKITQNVEAAYEEETGGYGNPPDSTLLHIGLLDTFDPRAVEMNITPVPSLGQSTDAFHAKGPKDVTLPLKMACHGTGWQSVLGFAIGRTYADALVTAGAAGSNDGTPMKLTNGINSIAVLARETGGDFTLVGGVVPNEVTLEADYTTGGYITLEANCTAQNTEDNATGDFSGGFYGDDYSNNTFPTAPTSDPLLPTDLTVAYSTAVQDDDMLKLNIAAGKYVEIGERYLRVFTSADILDNTLAASEASVPYNGVLDLTHARANTINSVVDRINATGLSSDSAAGSGAGNDASANLLKGIYKMTGALKSIPGVQSTSFDGVEGDMALFQNLKTVSLKIANNNTSIPGKTGTTWLQNNAISRGKADVTLDITMTPDDDTLYDKYILGTAIPLIRLDFGTSGSIALTNGTITSFSRPLTPGGEIVDTLSIKFRGAGDYNNFSSYAISADWTL